MCLRILETLTFITFIDDNTSSLMMVKEEVGSSTVYNIQEIFDIESLSVRSIESEIYLFTLYSFYKYKDLDESFYNLNLY